MFKSFIGYYLKHRGYSLIGKTGTLHVLKLGSSPDSSMFIMLILVISIKIKPIWCIVLYTNKKKYFFLFKARKAQLVEQNTEDV
jgi:hypothetical protein